MLEEKYAVIMAGGVGTRLWPLSKEKKPKQFISIDGNETLLVQTIKRIQEVVPKDNCFVITNKDYHDLTKETLKNLIPHTNIILEPLKKNTAACISYATLHLEKLFGTGLVCFIPADSYVMDKDEYLHSIRQAYHAAKNSKELIIIGVNPTNPATGYGYIQVKSEECFEPKSISRVVEFKEKPSIETAKEYIKSNKYLWNSGLVAGHLQAFISAIQQFIPKHFEMLSKALMHQNEPDFDSIIENAYSELLAISFDYGVLEKSKNLLAVKGSFNWYDIGSLDALSIIIGSDDSGNSIYGKHLGIDTKNSIIYSLENLITTIGLSDMIIVNVGDRIVVCPKDRVQDLKTLVENLKNNGYEKYI